MKNKIPLLVIAGPTASGKTALSVELAKIYNGEIVSADSMQIYKGLDIATAKPDEEEKCGIVHHLMGFLEQNSSFSVAEYVSLANKTITDIYNRGNLPIMCGGTGLYINSVVENIKFDDTGANPELRRKLERELSEKGADYLWNKLNEIDPETASHVHKNNTPRVIRGIEVFETTGIPLSCHKINSRREETPYRSCIIGLTATDRQFLYDRINRRVDVMVENGLVEECRQVYEHSELETACQAIGYKELIPYFENKANIDECLEKIKQETRHYAKRQLTWFRKVRDIKWVYIDKYENMEQLVEDVIKIIDADGIIL